MVLRGTSEDAGARREPLPLECIGPELDGSIAVLWKQRQTERQTDMPLFASAVNTAAWSGISLVKCQH